MPEKTSRVLSSWKEIAAYLGKGVRTVQRWERELNLPVRRPLEHNKRIVSAVPAELDAWIQQQLPRARTSGHHRAQVRMRDTHVLLAKLMDTAQQIETATRRLLTQTRFTPRNRKSE